jgi:hypothetical protein
VAREFVNLNRFKHGRAIKRDGKQKADLQHKMRIKGKEVRFRG